MRLGSQELNQSVTETENELRRTHPFTPWKGLTWIFLWLLILWSCFPPPSLMCKFNVKKRQRISMLFHWNFCCWQPPFYCASGCQQSEVAKPITVGQEYYTACIYLHMHLLYSQQVVNLSCFLGRNGHVITSFSLTLSGCRTTAKLNRKFLNFSELKPNQPIFFRPPNAHVSEGPLATHTHSKAVTQGHVSGQCPWLLLESRLKKSSLSNHPHSSCQDPHLESLGSWNDMGVCRAGHRAPWGTRTATALGNVPN